MIPLFRFVFFCAFLVFFLFEGWFDVEFFLCGFGHAVCNKVHTPSDNAANENVTECPAINSLPQYDVLELVVLCLDSNTLPVQFFPLYLHHGRQGHIRIGISVVMVTGSVTLLLLMVMEGSPPATIVAHELNNVAIATMLINTNTFLMFITCFVCILVVLTLIGPENRIP